MHELLRSLDLQPTIEAVQRDNRLDFARYALLREAADAKFHHLMGRVRNTVEQRPMDNLLVEQDLHELQQSCVRMSHLLQTSCLALRRLQLDVRDQRLAREALEGQIAYMQACLRRSLASFDQSA
ncbi:hypothetical protein BGP84_08765 [Pseudomonas putida]|uniref:Uncharacterized protein n=2 Tax=Pseudomonas TaxID=286 RepID=A0A2S3X3W8_PSEPU|nr:hypothetical protein [Pseudomonas putida]POG09818.1 hypothetical protein BGP84_08765 [Pseudomonas putida]POG15963.1 hypothetical protein BGP85_07250 [Pseudomonas putida]